LAVGLAHANITSLLLNAGAYHKVRNLQHKTSIEEARESGNYQIVDLIESTVRTIKQTKLHEMQQLNGQQAAKIERQANRIEQLEMLTQRMTNLELKEEQTAISTTLLPIHSSENQARLEIRLDEFHQRIAMTSIKTQLLQKPTRQKVVINDASETIKQISVLRQEHQTQKQAISFLYDKMKDAHKVHFETKYFQPQDIAAFSDGTYNIPIPEGFEEKDCSFLSISRGSNKGENKPISRALAHRLVSPYYAPNGDWLEAVSGVFAAKSVMDEAEATEKKRQYQLT
jgi:hypothetical protein